MIILHKQASMDGEAPDFMVEVRMCSLGFTLKSIDYSFWTYWMRSVGIAFYVGVEVRSLLYVYTRHEPAKYKWANIYIHCHDFCRRASWARLPLSSRPWQLCLRGSCFCGDSKAQLRTNIQLHPALMADLSSSYKHS